MFYIFTAFALSRASAFSKWRTFTCVMREDDHHRRLAEMERVVEKCHQREDAIVRPA